MTRSLTLPVLTPMPRDLAGRKSRVAGKRVDCAWREIIEFGVRQLAETEGNFGSHVLSPL